MKKIRVFSLLLCLILTLQCAVAPVWATQTENTTEETTETTTASEPTGPTYVIPEKTARPIC